MSPSRQLAVIMFTDISVYTTLMGRTEEKAFKFPDEKLVIQKPIIENFNGRY